MDSRKRGFPSHCICGERGRMLTSKTVTNPGRLFFACRYGDEKNRYHLFKWADESMVEEIEDMKLKIDDLERASSTFEKGLQACESEMETITMETRTCEAVVCGFEKEIKRFEKEIQECKMELRGLKNMVVCAVVMVLLYNFLM
ncbi:hypothetical protein EUTSA_v10003330mg [Eutrema salsugineum]|uniref:GRF-type domain-containing protein n=1 Tax=Eutrema salsugineum TaxID=72664 RepID=V4L3E8_EUTSA|nr:uncharacterized protein At4g04775 [Eutrema salsugineum]ESQ44840.1 hypothetical protein EUTSA_v10003330mg [Eutrema salsugineum]